MSYQYHRIRCQFHNRPAIIAGLAFAIRCHVLGGDLLDVVQERF